MSAPSIAVKVCGLTTLADARHAWLAGADLLAIIEVKAAGTTLAAKHLYQAVSYAANEENPLANGLLPEESPDVPTGAKIDENSRDKLDAYIADYNAAFGTQYSTNDAQSFYGYYQDIAGRQGACRCLGSAVFRAAGKPATALNEPRKAPIASNRKGSRPRRQRCA